MKLIIDNADLSRAIKIAARIVLPRNTIPVLGCCRLAAGPGGLTIEATDMERHISVTVNAEVETNGEILVDAGRLLSVANGLPTGGQARLALSSAMLGITSGRSRWRLGAPEHIDNWPKLAGIEADRFDLPGKAFAALLGRVAHAISTEESRHYLNGVFLQREPATDNGAPVLRAVATDGHKLARADMPWPAGLENSALAEGIILPRHAVGEVRAHAEETETVSVAVTSSMFGLEAGEVSMCSKLIDGTFPQYQRVIPAGEPTALIRVDGEALARAVRRVEGFAADTSKIIRSRAICLARVAGGIALAAGVGGEGDAVDRIETETEGEFDFFGLNGIYLRETLGAMEADTVEIALFGVKEPVRLRSLTDDSLLSVIMPMDAGHRSPAIAEAEKEETP